MFENRSFHTLKNSSWDTVLDSNSLLQTTVKPNSWLDWSSELTYSQNSAINIHQNSMSFPLCIKVCSAATHSSILLPLLQSLQFILFWVRESTPKKCVVTISRRQLLSLKWFSWLMSWKEWPMYILILVLPSTVNMSNGNRKLFKTLWKLQDQPN